MFASPNEPQCDLALQRHEPKRRTQAEDTDGHLEKALQRASTAAAKIASLTPRQRDVIDGMMRGLLNKEIAWSLGLSEKTVKMHRAQVLINLGCSTTAGAITIAVEASFALQL